MKRIAAILIALLLLTSVAYASQPYFKLEIDTPGEIFIDEILKLNITVTDHVYGEDNPTSAIDFSVAYNPEHFEFISLTSKNGVHATVGQTVSESVYADNRVLVGMVGSENAIVGNTDILTLNFRPKMITYKSLFTLHSAKAATATGIMINPGVGSTEITIANIYDVNRDGVIDILDLGLVSHNVGNDPIEYYYADINRDGIIDINDINILMQYMLNN
ncbi:MAG: dockerin type I domain-containing protein [Tissierellaceae bacterium]